MNTHHHINYIEFAAQNLPATKAFFSQVFGWTFVDYGPEYASFSRNGSGVDGGFYAAPLQSRTATGGALIVIYSADLEASLQAVAAAGGQITKPIFSFPGGRRFEFSEPSGNELAVWSE
jgi:predicted enzyme related to lactoylglutathione lyase